MIDPALLLDPDTLQLDADPDEDDLDSLLDTGDATGVVIADRELAEAWLQEAVWDQAKHPRWPPGSKDAAGKQIGGQWMRVGERFTKDGHVWEIAHVAHGHVIANEASGEVAKAETRVFAPTQIGGHNSIAGAVPAAIPTLHSGEGKAYGTSNVPVVDAEAKTDHDPSIKLPAGSPLTAEEWQRFGKVDQLLYSALAERWGPWKQGFAMKTVPKLMSEYTAKAQAAIQTAFSSQYGSSSGNSLSLQQVFHSGSSQGAKDLYREARELSGDIREANAWELMNRLHAPDVSVIHWGGGSTHAKVVQGTEALQSGYSTSWSSSITQFGSTATTMGVAARHILLATDLSKPAGSHFASEHEFATADRLKLNPGIAHKFKSSAMGAELSKWFNDHFGAHGGAMRPGSLIKAMHAHMKGEGTLPLPPPPPGLVYDKGENELYEIPPPNVVKEAAEKAKGAAYAHDETAEEALKPITSLGLEPGDIIEGHTVGKRYLVIADPGQPMGLRYMKLDGSNQTFTFSGSSERRKLQATVTIPPPAPKEGPSFDPDKWDAAGELQPLSKMKPGEKVKINGDYLEVTGQAAGHTQLKSLVTEKTAHANAGFPTAALGLKPGETDETTVHAPVGPPLTEGGLATMDVLGHPLLVRLNKPQEGEDGEYWHVTKPDGSSQVVPKENLEPFEADVHPGAAQKGDTFAHAGQKMVVTNVLKDGTVRARAAVPGAKVQDFAPDNPALGSLFRPGDYAPAGKVKLGQMPAGALFSGSPAKVKPYMVLGTPAGKQTHVLNLDTGEVSSFSKNKSYPSLVKPDEAAPVPPQATDMTAEPHDEFKVGDKITPAQLHVGDAFKDDAGNVLHVTGESQDGGVWKIASLGGQEYMIPKTMGGDATYLGPASEHVAPNPAVAPTEPASLPDAADHGFVAFKSNAGPGNAYKHDKLNMLAEGEHFFDKNGKLWKVKQAGETPIITDGVQNFQVDGKLRVKRAQHAKGGYTPLADQAPPVGSLADEASHVKMADLEDNMLSQSLGELGLQSGDYFDYFGKVAKVTAVDHGGSGADTFHAVTPDGETVKAPDYNIPAHYSKAEAPAAPDVPEPPAEAPAGAVPLKDVANGTLVANKQPHLPGGYLYSDDGNPAHAPDAVFTVSTSPSGGFDLIPTAGGATHTVALSSPTAKKLVVTGAPEAEPAATLKDLFVPGQDVFAKNATAGTVALMPGGKLVYKRPNGSWYELGGPEFEVSENQVVSTVNLNPAAPAAGDVKHAGQSVDVHDVADGQTFFIAGAPYLMLAHGSEGVDAMNLSSGIIASAGHDQHQHVELGTWTTEPAVPKLLAELPKPQDELHAAAMAAADEWLLQHGVPVRNANKIHQEVAVLKNGTADTWAKKYQLATMVYSGDESLKGPQTQSLVDKVKGAVQDAAYGKPAIPEGVVPMGSPMPFVGVSVGSHFYAHDAIWRKESDGDAVMVKKVGQNQMADPGFVETGWQAGDSVQQVVPPEAKKLAIKDMPKDTKFWWPSENGEFIIGQKNPDGVRFVAKIGDAKGDMKIAAGSPLQAAEFSVTKQGVPTVGDLEPGDQFTVPKGYHGEGTTHEVVDALPTFHDGWQTVKTKNLATGQVSSTATQLAPDNIVKVPETPPEVPDGWQLAHPASGEDYSDADSERLGVGDEFKTPGGTHYKVLSVTDPAPPLNKYELENVETGETTKMGNPAVSSYKKAAAPEPAPTPASVKQGDPIGVLNVGDSYTFPEHGAKYTVTAKTGGHIELTDDAGAKHEYPLDKPFAADPIVTPKPEPVAGEMPIKPYGSTHQSGGKAKYHKLSELQPGEQFTDKAGAKYTVAKHQTGPGGDATSTVQGPSGGMVTIPHTFVDAKGETKPVRVKKLTTSVPAAPEPGVASKWSLLKVGDLIKLDWQKEGAEPFKVTADLGDQWEIAYTGESPGGVVAKSKVSKTAEVPVKVVGHDVQIVSGPGNEPTTLPVPEGAVATSALKAGDKITFGQDGLNTFTVAKPPDASGSFQVKSDQTGQVQQYLVHSIPHVWPAEVTPSPQNAEHAAAMKAADEWLKRAGTAFGDKPVDAATINAIHHSAVKYHHLSDWGQAYVYAAGDHLPYGPVLSQHHQIKDVIAPPSALPTPKVGLAQAKTLIGQVKDGKSISVDGGVATVKVRLNDDGDFDFRVDGGGHYVMPGGKAIAAIKMLRHLSDNTAPPAAGVAQYEKHAPEPESVASAAFFNSLANGDKALYDGPHGAKVVTVTDNQIPGPGVQVKSDASGAEFQAFKHQLSPVEQWTLADGHAIFGDGYKGEMVKDLDVGDVFKQSNSGTVWKVLSIEPFKMESVQSGTVVSEPGWEDELDKPIIITKKAADAPAPAAAQPIPDYTGTKLTGGKAAGGSTGAQIMTGPGGKWLKKTYGGNQDRVATELLANRIYDTLGVKVAQAGKLDEGGKTALAYPLEGGSTTHFSTKYGPGDDAKRKALGEDFMADALTANYDFVGLEDDNVLWNGDAPTRIDQGGTFFYRAQGDPKEFTGTPTEAFSMLAKGQGKRGVLVSEASMRQQATHIADELTPEKIDALVDAAPFKDTAMREKIRTALKSRVQWMKEFGEGQHEVPADVQAKLLPSEPEMPGEPVSGKYLKAGDKILHHGDTWIVNGDSDDGQHVSLTNEAGWMSTTVPKDDTIYQHIGYGKPADEDGVLEPAAPAAGEMPIVPYGSPYQTGGKKPYHKISALEPGEKFRDKAGKLYTVGGHVSASGEHVGNTNPTAPSGSTTAYDQAAGKFVDVPHTFTDAKGKTKLTRVKKVEL